MIKHFTPAWSLPSLRLAIAYRSDHGHAARQAEAVAPGAGSVPETHVDRCNVAELAEELWTALDRADAIIFGAPPNMGSPSAQFKAFAEATSKV